MTRSRYVISAFSLVFVAACAESRTDGPLSPAFNDLPDIPDNGYVEPYLDGPEIMTGRVFSDRGLVCNSFPLTLVYAEGETWDYEGGLLEIAYLRWGPDLNRWLTIGRSERVFGPDLWEKMQAGTFALGSYRPDLVRRTQAFEATFTITIHRHGEDLTFTEEVAHSLTCVAPDFADRF
jgi:hypothetical protein